MFDERGVLQRALQQEKSEHITSVDDDSNPTILNQGSQRPVSAPAESLSSPTPARAILQSSKAAKSVSPQSKVSKRSSKTLPAKMPTTAASTRRTRAQSKLQLSVKDDNDSVNILLDCPASFMTFPVHFQPVSDYIMEVELAFALGEMTDGQVFSPSDPLTDAQAEASSEKAGMLKRER